MLSHDLFTQKSKSNQVIITFIHKALLKTTRADQSAVLISGKICGKNAQ